jgi:hypothetical protein
MVSIYQTEIFFQINLNKIFLGLLNCLKVHSFLLSFTLFKQKNTNHELNPNPNLSTVYSFLIYVLNKAVKEVLFYYISEI